MSDTGNFEEEIGFTFNPAEAQRVAEQMARTIRTAVSSAFRGIEKELSGILSQAARGNGARKVAEGFEGAAREAQKLSQETQQLQADLAALTKRSEAFKDTLRQTGANSNLFAVVDTELEKVLRLEREIEQRREEIASDPDLLNAYRLQATQIGRTIRTETQSNERLLRNLRESGRQDAARELQREAALARERQDIRQDARSRYVVETQREAAQVLAETRIAGQRIVQAERQRSRARIEIARFTFRQIQFIERQVANAFRGVASVIGGGLTRIEAGAQRLGQVFRRSNRELNEGLNGALIQRESTLARSFSRQETEIRTSLSRQERVIERFQAQASRGVAGAVTGRSSIGGLLGGGLAFGGGFLLIDKLREGFEESVNLNEALNKTRVIFGDATDEILRFSETSVEALFITRSEALAAAANFGIFGKAAGLTGKPLADFSKNLVSLATDLASFNNTSVEDATTAISAALRGESEPIRRYGVLLNEATLQQRAFDLGITDSIRKLQPFERVLAANAEIFEQTSFAQGDAARTADDFANSSRRAAAASTETAAAIAGAFVPIAERLTNGVYPVLLGITAFIRGEVSPALLVLRQGLIGAAAALGGLVAARVAGEALQFLALALRQVLTPLGLFVTAVALLGAAINILANRSPAVRAALERLADAVRTGLGFVVDQAARGLQFLGDIIANYVAPLIERLAQFLAANMARAFQAGFGFLIGTVVPALVRFGNFISDDVIPPLVDLAQLLAERVVAGFFAARDAAVSLFRVVQPYIQPAIDGFAQLGDAIAAAIGDRDFSGILGGLSAVAQGIGQSFANVGELIIDSLRPQVERAIGYLRGVFSADNLRDVGLGFLEVVEAIGFILGSIVTDRRFVIAVEAVIAAAVAIGAKLIQGIIRGFISNVPELTDLFSKQLAFAFNAAADKAFDGRAIATAIIAAIGAVAIGSAILQTLRRPVEQAGQSTGRVFATALGRTLREGARGRGSNDFAAGFFGGVDGLERAATRAGQRGLEAMAREQRRAAAQLNALGRGSGGIAASFVGSDGITANVRNSVAQLDKLKAKFGEAAVTGATLRGSVSGILEGVKTVGRGVGEVVDGIRRDFADPGRSTIQSGLRQIGTSFSTGLVALRENLKASGIGIGQAIGGAIVSGVGAALAGQQLGRGGTGGTLIGLAGIISSSLFAAAAVGGGPQGVAVGAIVASIGVVTAAITRNGEEAQKAKVRVEEWRDALGDVTGTEAQAAATQRLVDVVTEADIEIQRAFEGFDFGALTSDLLSGVDPLQAVLQRLGSDFGATAATISAAFEAAGGDVSKIRAGFQSSLPADRVFRDLRDEIRAAGGDTGDFLQLLSLLTDEGSAVGVALESIDIESTFKTDAPKTAADAIERAKQNADGFFDRLAAINNEPGFDTVRQSADLAQSSVRDVAFAVDFLNDQRLAPIRTEIDGVTSDLEAARTAANEAREQLTAYLTGDYTNTAQEALDQVILSLGGVQSAIEEAGQLGGLSTEAGAAKLREITGGFDEQLAAIIRAGFEQGLDTVPELTALLDPLRRAVDQTTFSPDPELDAAIKANMQAQIDAALGDDALTAGLTTITDADAEVARLQGELDQLNAQLKVDVVFDPEQIRSAFREIFGTDLEGLIPAEFRAPDFFSRLGDLNANEANTRVPTAALVGAQQSAQQFTATGPVTSPASADAAARSGITVENLNIYETASPLATGREAVLALGAVAGGVSAPTRSNVLPILAGSRS